MRKKKKTEIYKMHLLYFLNVSFLLLAFLLNCRKKKYKQY